MRIKQNDIVLCIDPGDKRDIDAVYIVTGIGRQCRDVVRGESCGKCRDQGDNHYLYLKKFDCTTRTHLGLYPCRFSVIG